MTAGSPIGVGWVAEPVHWSELKPGDVLEFWELGEPILATVTNTGAVEGRRWIRYGIDGAWAPDGQEDPLAMKLVRRDVLVGEVAGEPEHRP